MLALSSVIWKEAASAAFAKNTAARGKRKKDVQTGVPLPAAATAVAAVAATTSAATADEDGQQRRKRQIDFPLFRWNYDPVFKSRYPPNFLN